MNAETKDLPCCGPVQVRRVRELPHVYGFDFDLFQCVRCDRYWVSAFGVSSINSWEEVTNQDAEKMKELPSNALRAFMKEWAGKFN